LAILVTREFDVSKTLKFGIIILIVLCLLLLAVTLIDLPAYAQQLGIFSNDNATPQPEAGSPDINAAVTEALDGAPDNWKDQHYQIDHIEVQDDGQMAVVWLAATDPETGDFLGREPELAIAELDADNHWNVLLDGEEKFDETFAKFQYAEKSVQGDPDVDAQPKSTAVYGGYYLPWAKGLTKRLTWSVSHTSCTPTYYCTHAFDFADGTMFPLVAAKGGTVYHWKDTCANGDSSCTNSITLQDRSTTPWTYQIYMHIAQDSIPDNLRKVGTPVMQGQYIADVDDTGYSTGHHVHFMVVSENTKYLSHNGYIFGMAEDITFRDVTINWDSATQGGRPRLAYEAEDYGGEGKTYYTSGNAPANPPTGGLSSPATKTFITNSELTIKGWAKDDVSIIKIELLANYDSEWVSIGELAGATSFTTTVNLCETDIPAGPFKLAMRVWDYEGNPSSILSARTLFKGCNCTESGTAPIISLIPQWKDHLLLNSGIISASVTEGSTGSDIASVEFWFLGSNWSKSDWVNLGTDTNGSNGWQAAINTASLAEGSSYTVAAIATDLKGNQGVDVDFKAVVDKTAPNVDINTVRSPVEDETVTLNWSASDALTDIDHYALSVKINDAQYQIIDDNLPKATTSYQYPVAEGQLLVFQLTAVDIIGNERTVKSVMYTKGYEFPNSYSFPIFNNNN
jgi:hypothetical protein